MATRYNNQDLPLSFYFEDRFQRQNEVLELWENKEDMRIEKFPVIKENSIIGVKFFVSKEEEHDPESYCSIQTNLYDQMDERMEIKQFLGIGLSEKKWIYQGKDNEEYPWRMGVYFLEVYYKGKRYWGGINVLPRHLDENQVSEIHSYLNEQVQDIIYDFIYSSKKFSNNEKSVLPKYWYYDYASKIAERFEEFMYIMTAIEKNPANQILSVYIPSVLTKKLDRKSIQWAMSAKGLAKNTGNNQHGFQLNKEKAENINSNENQWVKNIILVWKKDVYNVTTYIKRDFNQYKDKMKEHKEEHSLLCDKKEYLLGKKDTGENTKKNINSQIFMLEKEMKNTNTKIAILKKKLDVLSKMESKLIFFLSSPLLKNTVRAKRKPFLKNSKYHRLDSIFEELNKIRKSNGQDSQISSVLKPTWQIYEYFCLFKVIKILTDSGYSIVQGLGEDLLNLYFEDRIQEGTKFILENNDEIIHVWYDHYHAHTEKEALEKGELFYTPNPKKKPDFKIDYFKKTENGKLFSSSIVMDSKFSELKTIYNHQYRNKTTEQLVGYYHYFCVLPEAGHRPCIDRVVCLYAGEGNRDVQQINESITYLRFHPAFGEDGPYLVGEKQLKEILQLT